MRLTDYLRQHELTHTEFAAKIGATQAAVTRYVNGRRKPSLNKLLVIERVTEGAVQARDFADVPAPAEPANEASSAEGAAA
ncbi:MAG: helix-turn-helix transcriptional regulator [Hyphomicrobiales bacterium]